MPPLPSLNPGFKLGRIPSPHPWQLHPNASCRYGVAVTRSDPCDALTTAGLPDNRYLIHPMTLSKLLVANRGEIAIRIIRAAADMGISTVSIYSTDDAKALHVHKADQAVPLT